MVDRDDAGESRDGALTGSDRRTDTGREITPSPDEPIDVEGSDHLSTVLAANEVVLLEFHADWCGPCEALEPVVERIAEQTSAAVAKVDIEAHEELAEEFDVRGVPMLVVFDGGDAVERVIGAKPAEMLVHMVELYTG